MKIRSLRGRLGLAVVGVLVFVLSAFSVAIHALIARAVSAQLDARLAGDAAAVAGMAEQDPHEPAELEFESLPDFEQGPSPAYYQLWLDDGRILGRSPSLTGRDLPRDAADATVPIIRALTLPDGRPGRAIQVRRELRREDAGPRDVVRAAPGQGVTVVVARSTAELAATLRALSRWLWALSLVTLLAGSAAAFAALSRGLRPVRHYAAALAQLDDRRLGSVPSGARLPRELAPIAEKLTQLLARLADSFARERRFTADVSHELRTPLSALRAILEVADSRDRAAPAYRTAIQEASQVARRMHGLVEDLLTMARLDARQVPVHLAQVPLRALVADCWRPFESRAGSRGLTFTNQIDAAVTADSDPDKLRVIVTNLLANAVEYTAPGGTIVARGGSDATLEVWDSGPPIAPEVLPRIFDRFFRADPARTDTHGHAGIGLALVKGMCDVLKLSVRAANTADGGVSFQMDGFVLRGSPVAADVQPH